MGKLPRMGKPPYLKPHFVQDGDVLQITGEPYVKSEEESKFGRQRGYAAVRLIRTGEEYTWGMNSTTWDRLIDGFGEDSALWVNKKVKVKLDRQMIRGEDKQIIYGMPYLEPQKNLAA